MPDVGFMVMLFTYLSACLGLLALTVLDARGIQKLGAALLVGSLVGGGFISLSSGLVGAVLTIGAGLLTGLALYVFFGSGGAF